MIVLREVTKTFEQLKAVCAVDLHINQGSIYGILGSNGAGKTTILKMIAGIYRQDLGDISVDGERIFENISTKQDIFFVPDSPFFFGQYSVKWTADFYKSIYTNWSDERFAQLKNIFKIDLNKKVHSLSKGLQRQVALWCALSTQPKVLLLDEPMDGFDPVIRHQFRNALIEEVANRQMTIVISSHNLDEIEDLCDTITILHQGKKITERELDDFKSDIHKVQMAFSHEIPKNLLEGFQVLKKELRGNVLICVIKGAKEEIIQKIKVHEPVLLDILPLTLEEIFVYEMGDLGYGNEN